MQSVGLLINAHTSQTMTNMAAAMAAAMANVANLISIICTIVLSLIKMKNSTLMSHITWLH